MRRMSAGIMAAMAIGACAASIRKIDDEEIEAERETSPKADSPAKAIHSQSRESARRLRQLAKIEAKRRKAQEDTDNRDGVL